MITAKQYYEVTRNTSDCGIDRFTWQEIQNYLSNRGYDILIVKGVALVQDSKSEGVSVVPVGDRYDKVVEDVVALLPVDIGRNVLPKRFDDPSMAQYRVMNVFQRELRKTLLA